MAHFPLRPSPIMIQKDQNVLFYFRTRNM